MTLVLVSAISLLAGLLLRRRRPSNDHRLGLLATEGSPSAEARRSARLAELGERGTYKVYNCGEILHVDYERSELICARDWRHRR